MRQRKKNFEYTHVTCSMDRGVFLALERFSLGYGLSRSAVIEYALSRLLLRREVHWDALARRAVRDGFGWKSRKGKG